MENLLESEKSDMNTDLFESFHDPKEKRKSFVESSSQVSFTGVEYGKRPSYSKPQLKVIRVNSVRNSYNKKDIETKSDTKFNPDHFALSDNGIPKGFTSSDVDLKKLKKPRHTVRIQKINESDNLDAPRSEKHTIDLTEYGNSMVPPH